uniref:Uncharacterized protein n=1 Tax=viral metagenome TaxID=1070528 RepID=A0A6C0IC78_9ZZZZ
MMAAEMIAELGEAVLARRRIRASRKIRNFVLKRYPRLKNLAYMRSEEGQGVLFSHADYFLRTNASSQIPYYPDIKRSVFELIQKSPQELSKFRNSRFLQRIQPYAHQEFIQAFTNGKDLQSFLAPLIELIPTTVLVYEGRYYLDTLINLHNQTIHLHFLGAHIHKFHQTLM